MLEMITLTTNHSSSPNVIRTIYDSKYPNTCDIPKEVMPKYTSS